MNKSILNTKNQEFINKNLNSNLATLLLKKPSHLLADIKLIAAQIEAKKRCKKKLPTWFNAKNIYYANKLNIEQTSSEITAEYKSHIVSGKTLIDLTGGFGVDSFYFSKHIKQVTHCEIDEDLSNIVKHNYKQLQVNNMSCICENGIETLKSTNKTFDWIYIDPSRRDDLKGKVFLLKDCLPNVPKHLDLFFKRSKHIMIKTSPLLDITSGISELKHVKTIHAIAVNNEVKELLWVLDRGYHGHIKIETINLKKEANQPFGFLLSDEKLAKATYSQPLSYLYKPNAALLKAGAFNYLSEKLKAYKLHQHSHLYTSDVLVDFPGRSFKIEKVIPYNKKEFKSNLRLTKANVSTRNFPETVQQIRKKLSISDGGNDYLFFTTDCNNNKIIIHTQKT